MFVVTQFYMGYVTVEEQNTKVCTELVKNI